MRELAMARKVLQYGARASLQFLWAWASIATSVLALIGLTYLGIAVAVGANLFIVAEIFLVIFAKGRCIHDRIPRARVVLDAARKHVIIRG